MCQDELANPGLGSEGCHIGGSGVSEGVCHFVVFGEVGRFDHHHVCSSHVLTKLFGFSHIADNHQAHALALRAEDVFGSDHSAVFQSDSLPLDEVPPARPVWHAQRLSSFRQERSMAFFRKPITQGRGTAVVNRKCPDIEVLALENQAGFDFEHIQWHRGFGAPQYHAVDQVSDAVHCVAAAVDVDLFNRFPPHKSRKHASQTEDVVEVTMGEEDVIQAFKAHPGFEDLPLGAFAAINHKTILIVLNDKRG